MKILTRNAGEEFERIVYSELLIPDVPNCYGDITTPDAIKEFAHQFAIKGYGIDVEHDQEDVLGKKLVIVESFIAREGDPDFIVGSWVLGMKILDDDLWAGVVNGTYNGFSYQATVEMQEVLIQNLRNREVVGVTEPDLIDGHTHTYLVIVGPLNEVLSGGTGETDGHSHTITSHTYTDYSDGHRHRYQVINETSLIGESA